MTYSGLQMRVRRQMLVNLLQNRPRFVRRVKCAHFFVA
jgi:hypothetical protein